MRAAPVAGGRTIRLCSLWPSDDLPTPLRPPVDTGAGDRGGSPPSLQWLRRLSAAERVLTRWSSGRGESNLRTRTKSPLPQISHLSVKSHSGLHPTPPSNPGLAHLSHQNGHVPRGTCGLMDIQHPAVLDDHLVVSAQSQLSTCGDARPQGGAGGWAPW